MLPAIYPAPDPHEFFADFIGDKILHKEVSHERVNNWVSMVQEAHAKFHFKSGKIYFNLWDNATDTNYTGSDFYQQSFKKEDFDKMINFTGPDWTSLNFPSAHVKDFSVATFEIMQESEKTPKYNKIGWIGNVHSPLPDKPEFKTRPMLLDLTTKYPDYFCFKHGKIDGGQKYLQEDLMSDLVKNYAYLLDIGGNGE